MIDSHCHLDHEPLINNLNDVLERSKKVGIDKLLTISTNVNSYKNILNLIKQDPMIYGSIGIHPHEVQTSNFEKNYIVHEQYSFSQNLKFELRVDEFLLIHKS